MKTVYIVNSNEKVLKEIKEYLEIAEYEVKVFLSSKDAFTAIKRRIPDAVILDLSLSDGNGLVLLKNIRKNYSFPVIILSERNAESDRILSFELGCDDYMAIPYSEKEMLLRLNAIFRRISKNSADTANTGLWRIGNDSLRRDNSSHTFFLNENKITLTLSEWKILSELTENAGILITRTKLLEKCLNFQAGYERVIDTHIKNIRSKLGQEWIETVRGYGYKFIGEKAK